MGPSPAARTMSRRVGGGRSEEPRLTARSKHPVLRASFDLYGLGLGLSKPTWVAQHDELPSHVVLGHGDPESRWAKVGVLLRESNHPGASVDVVDTLAGMHGAEEGLHLTLEQTHGMKWADVDLAVEGVPRRFRMIGDEQ